MKTILFIDGRNFISKINSILNPDTETKKEIDFSIYNFAELFNKVLAEIKVLKNKGTKRIYLGFENSPNKGLTFTTNRTILIRNSEVSEFLGKTLI